MAPVWLSSHSFLQLRVVGQLLEGERVVRRRNDPADPAPDDASAQVSWRRDSSGSEQPDLGRVQRGPIWLRLRVWQPGEILEKSCSVLISEDCIVTWHLGTSSQVPTTCFRRSITNFRHSTSTNQATKDNQVFWSFKLPEILILKFSGSRKYFSGNMVHVGAQLM